MSEKYDYRLLRDEIAEDEKVVKARPVLLSQREIQELVEKRRRMERVEPAEGV